MHRLIDNLEPRLLFARPYGVDVSYYQTTNGTTNIINWTNAKNNSAIEFAFIRSSYGNSSADTAFASQAAAAKAAGILVGAYHYAYPETAADAITEANNFMNRAAGYMGVGNLPPVLDMEDETSPLTNAQLTTWTNDFCNHIYNTIGVRPIVYCNTNWAINKLGSSVTQWPLWIANYNYNSTHQTANPPVGVWGSGNWKFFQYTSAGSISGYTGNIDRNVFNGTSAELQTWAISDREVVVTLDGGNVADGQATAIDFGSVNLGSPAPQKTFTVTNSGELLLTLSNLQVPTGYTIVSNFGATSLRAGESTTFTVQLNTTTGGTKTGNIQFTTNDADEGIFNFPVTGTVISLNPPTNLQITGYSASNAAMSWTDNTSTETSFKIERKTGSGGTWAQIASVNANVTSYNDTTAPAGAQLYYRVRAHDGSQYSPYSGEAVVTTLAATPTNVVATDTLPDKINVSWNPATGAVSYQVYRGTSSNVAFASLLTSTTQTQYDDLTAAANTTYFYFIRSVNSASQVGIISAGESGYRLVDNVAPTIVDSIFHFDTVPMQVRIRFSEDVGASVNLSDLTVVNDADQTPVTLSGPTWDAGTFTAGWSLPANLPAGNYTASLVGAISDAAGNPLGNSLQPIGFHVLPGDFTRDRRTNTLDFNVMAAHFGLSGAIFSQGDQNLDGQVDSLDFNVFNGSFGASVPQPAASAAPLFSQISLPSDELENEI